MLSAVLVGIALASARGPAPRATASRAAQGARARARLVDVQVDPAALAAWGLRPPVLEPGTDEFARAATPLNANPPAFAIDNFLSAAECAMVIELAKRQRAAGTAESDLYLNYRVNREVESGGGGDGASGSAEARKLIEGQELSEAQLSANAPSGFRVFMGALAEALEAGDGTADAAAADAAAAASVDAAKLGAALGGRLLRLLGLPRRRLRLAEGIWVKPDRRYVIVRDLTVVHYRAGEGVAPHVDGKDATVLVYLNEVAEGQGGRTVFVEDGFASRPRAGRALIYWSKHDLLHYSEALGSGDKWIMQFLIDFKHKDTGSGPYVDFTTGRVIEGL
jgi:hypothetical protein